MAGGGLRRSAKHSPRARLAAIGALILLEADPRVHPAAIALGGTLVLLGLSEALSVTSAAAVRPPVDRRRRRAVVTAGALAIAALGAATAVILIGRGGPPAPPSAGEINTCNGGAALCDRRLDQVVLPGTHNSMSAADRPGWYFANQIRPIPHQLRDGIRLLMIDPHYGVEDSDGRVRTDLRAEGTNRNRVAGRLGAQAVESPSAWPAGSAWSLRRASERSTCATPSVSSAPSGWPRHWTRYAASSSAIPRRY